jgi:DNA-binding transcriptional LysR family regulator
MDPFCIQKYIEMGLGIALVPTRSWGDLFPENIVLKDIGNIRRKTYAYLSKRHHVKRCVELFLQTLMQTAAEQETPPIDPHR